MKQYALILLALTLCPMASHAISPDKEKDNSTTFTWGGRIGFAATGSYLTDARIDGHKITEYTQDTQVGNFFALQFRLNSNRFLIQTGLGLSHNKSSFSVDRNSWNPDSETTDYVSCSFSMRSLTLPLQAGYHITSRAPYYMSVFTGPRLRYTPEKQFSSSFTNLEPYQFSEYPEEFVVSWTVGLSVQIGRTFFDFEYEQSINDVTGPLTDSSGAASTSDYRLDRRIGIISFSYGIMF